MTDQQQIIEAIAESLGLPAVDVDFEASLKDDLSLNPVEIADLFDHLSARFKIIFEPVEMEQLKTVGDLVEIIEDKLLE